MKVMCIDDNYSLVGSANYKQQKYPGDLDIIETVDKCCSEEEAIDFLDRMLSASQAIEYNKLDKIMQGSSNYDKWNLLELTS